MTRFQGNIFEARATYTHEFEFYRSQLKISYSNKWATQELQALYYEVPIEKATPNRSEFKARDGVLSQDLTYYQSFKSGRFSFSLGTSLGFYGNAANRQSPLHKSDFNMTGFVGLNYVLGESRKSAIPEEDTSGLINSLRAPRGLRDSY